MTIQKEQSAKTNKRILLCVAVLLAAVAIAYTIFLCISHGGDTSAQNIISHPAENVIVEKDEHLISFIPSGNIKAGVVFYPGAKIHADAYASLANALAANGYLCVLVNMPANLSILDNEAAIPIMQKWANVSDWYIAGHSMGGFGAEQCAHKHPELFNGLILLAARIRNDFSDIPLPVLAVYASNDGICSPEKLAKTKIPKPQNYTEVNIDGGCHAYFGSYGPQTNDGIPTITRDEQQKQTVDAILAFLEKTQ